MAFFPRTKGQVPREAPTKGGMVYLKTETILSFSFHMSRSQCQIPKGLQESPGLTSQRRSFYHCPESHAATHPRVRLEGLKS